MPESCSVDPLKVASSNSILNQDLNLGDCFSSAAKSSQATSDCLNHDLFLAEAQATLLARWRCSSCSSGCCTLPPGDDPPAPPNASQGPDSPSSPAETRLLAPGSRVRIQNQRQNPINGMVGVVRAWDPSRGRYIVQLLCGSPAIMHPDSLLPL